MASTLRQQVLVLYLSASALDSKVIAWSRYDGTGTTSPITVEDGEPPYGTGIGALRDGWRLFQVSRPQPPQGRHESDVPLPKHEFFFEKLVAESPPAGPDIAWRDSGKSYKVRAAGIVVHDGRLLVCYADVVDGCFAPGGKVRFGESAAAAVHRELVEEIGVSLAVGDPALISEAVYEDGGVLHQEVGFYFRLDWPRDLPPGLVGQVPHEGERFDWVPIDELPAHGFKPPEILPHLFRTGGPIHLVFDRRTYPSE